MAASGKSQAERAGWITVSQAEKLLLCTDVFLRKLSRDGHIPKAERGMYPLIGVVQGYVKFLRGEHRDKTQAEAERGLKAARQREVELRIARDLHQLVEFDEVEMTFSETLGAFRSELNGIPAACTRDLEMRATIEKQVNGALERCRHRFAVAEEALRTGAPVVLDVPAATAG